MQDRKPRLAGPRLVGRVAIVTGAGSSGPGVGTGKATSICFAREGAKVLLVDRITQRAGETLDSIVAEGGEASVFEADITLAVKHGRDNIRVNCILPGLIYTPMVAG